jgi:predicted nucleic acid-binding protein
LGKVDRPRSREASDIGCLAAALSAHARSIVTNEKDLLELDKSFAIEVLKPADFLHRMMG